MDVVIERGNGRALLFEGGVKCECKDEHLSVSRFSSGVAKFERVMF